VTAVEWAALGTEAVLAVTASESLPAAREAVDVVLADFDVACSRFREDSELSRVNRAQGTWVEIGPLFLRAQLVQDISRHTRSFGITGLFSTNRRITTSGSLA